MTRAGFESAAVLYLILARTNRDLPGVAGALNRNGGANLTVCPVCGVDDFTHVESCSIGKILDREAQEATT